MNHLKFQKLTPTTEVDLTAYEEGFDFIFSNEDIHNVAISGPYSSGKSSLLESYKEQHPDKKFIHISLAHFSDDSLTNEKNTENTTTNESVIEGKILNQLIQQIPAQNIPQSNFRVKRTSESNNNFYWAIGIVSFSTILVFILNYGKYCNWISEIGPNKWKYYWLKDFLTYLSTPAGIVLCICALTGIACTGLYHLLNIQFNKNIFKRISVQGNEIEIFEDTQNSYFDKYLNEVLYLFENSYADVIVFEDIDRFENIQIFERLREINMLTNYRLQQHEDEERILRFFYLLRDDIFITKDRTKFFDYILPVIPVLDSSNSYNKIKEFFTGLSMDTKLDDRFLKGLSLYIDDLRVLKNIYNEFVFYYERLNKISLDPNRMLAIITYKNLFPKDFANLQLNRGFVHAIISNKEKYIKQEVIQLDDELQKLRQRVADSEAELAVSMEELNDIRNAKYYTHYRGGNITHAEFVKWENDTLPLRKQAVADKTEKTLKQLKKKIEEIETTKRKITGLPLSQIITRDNIDEIFQIQTENELGDAADYHQIKKSDYFDLLKYLIRNGYIDESYNDYMTYFYDNSLSLNDKTYLRSVNDKKAKDYSYRIDSPILVLSDLVPADFHQEETLNYSLLEYLLDNLSSYTEYLAALSAQFKENDCYAFISGFFSLDRKRKEFVCWLNEQWPDFWKTAFNEDRLSKDQIHLYSVYSVTYSSTEVLVSMNEEHIFSSFISNNEDFLLPSECNTDNLIRDKIIKELIALKIKFSSINPLSEENLITGVYENNLYILNTENIQLFLHLKYRQDMYEFKDRLLTFIMAAPNESLSIYVNENLDIAVRLACEISQNRINDNESIIALIINSNKVSIDTKELYISLLTTVLSNISDITEVKYKNSLLAHRLISPTAKNIYEYYSVHSLTPTLIEFINGTSEEINFSSTEFDENVISKFIDKVQLSNEIADYHYRNWISAKGKILTDLDTANLKEAKIKILIDESKIEMNIDTLVYMRQHHSNLLLFFIQKNLNSYCNIMTYRYVEKEEIEYILSCNILEFDKATELIEMLGVPLSVVKHTYNDKIMLYILNNYFSEDDFIPLLNKFDLYPEDIQSSILDLINSRMEKILESLEYIGITTVKSILSSSKFECINKVKLLCQIIKTYKVSDISECMESAGYNDISKLLKKNTRPTIKVTKEHDQFMEALTTKGIITSYAVNADKGIYSYRRIN